MSAAPANEIRITLPDGSVRTTTRGATGADVAASIGPGLAKAALAVKVDGELKDLDWPIQTDAKVEIVTRKSEEALDLIRHDTAHLLAQAVQELYPGTQVTIGPNIEDGFFYDFARNEPFTPEDLPKIEAKMRELVAADLPTKRTVWERDKAVKHFRDIGEQYKAEIIRDLPADEEVRVYYHGDWHDLCRGPHLPSTGKIGTRLQADQDRRRLLARRRQERAAAAHLRHRLARREGTRRLSAARRRGREARPPQDRQGDGSLPHSGRSRRPGLLAPEGLDALSRTVENYIRRKIEQGRLPRGEDPAADRPQALGRVGPLGELSPQHVHRRGRRGRRPRSAHSRGQADELPGPRADLQAGPEVAIATCRCAWPSSAPAIATSRRARCTASCACARFVQDDAHIFCTEEQIVSETKRFVELADARSIANSASTASSPSSRRARRCAAARKQQWDHAEAALANACNVIGLPYTINPGEGTFYAPKLEFVLRDAIGRDWQCGTIQLDYVLPERLDAEYVAEDGTRKRPVMLHRAIVGSLERFIGVLIEHHAGKFPLWLAPVQAVVATIVNDADAYAEEATAALKKAGIRVETDLRNEKINYKVREHSLAKVPYLLVAGRKEAERTHALRAPSGLRKAGDDDARRA